ncbi:MAG TPA: phosphotransferase [Pyrinomonadaceae bacterium]|nr:phosphotransferase [Pyrinomonadaceae bacterium]
MEQESLARRRRLSSKLLHADWAQLCRRFLPVRGEAIWRYSRQVLPADPEQGWKLHVPATVLTAGRVLRRVGPLLRGRGVLFKAPATLEELHNLNSGVDYGYSQVGKFLTVYPPTDAEALLLAERLRLLTRGMRAPSVPFDRKYGRDGCVYYRYGAFKVLEAEGGGGESVYAVRDPEGRLVPDVRDSAVPPEWAEDPFPREEAPPPSPPRGPTPLQTTFKAFRALTQRGRGGVYQALDLGGAPPRLCILKEGRRDGEVDWNGRDGAWRIRHEGRVLRALGEAGLNVPRLYASFGVEGNRYIAVEFIEGESLNDWLGRRRRRLPVADALRYGAELARLVAGVHAAGWVWRDCKPGNVMVTKAGGLRPLDFEGACPVPRPDPLPWGTPEFMSPEARAPFSGRSRLPEDLYALGAVVYLLLAGRTPDATPAPPLAGLRRGVPLAARDVVMELLGPDPSLRPSASEAASRLEEARARLDEGRAGQGLRLRRRERAANLGSARRPSYMGSVSR